MIAVEGGMLQTLSSRGDEETSADQLAELTNRPKLDIGKRLFGPMKRARESDSSSAVRALRLLTAIGVCDELGAQRYRANDKTQVMASRGQVGGLRVRCVQKHAMRSESHTSLLSMVANETFPIAPYSSPQSQRRSKNTFQIAPTDHYPTMQLPSRCSNIPMAKTCTRCCAETRIEEKILTATWRHAKRTRDGVGIIPTL